MGVYPAPITCRNPSATVGNRRHGDYVGTIRNPSATVGTSVCLDYVGTRVRLDYV